MSWLTLVCFLLIGALGRIVVASLPDTQRPSLEEVSIITDVFPLANPKPKPNIFMVLVDDWGWNDVSYRRHATDAEIDTPIVEQLAEAGIKLNRHYTYNYCSPSRSSLQSGRLPNHVSVENTQPTAHNPKDPVSGFAGIPRNMTGIAEKLRAAGYRTHMTGKWDGKLEIRAFRLLGVRYHGIYNRHDCV